MFLKNGIKRAEIVLEEVLAVGLAIMVLFLILNLFGDNINKMLKSSNLHKAMNSNQTKKTAYETFNKNPTKTQVNVQIVADQASLAWYHDQAQQQIEKLDAVTTTLTDMQRTELAKAVTIFSQSGPQGENMTTVLTKTFDAPTYTGVSYSDNNNQTRKKTFYEVKSNHHIIISEEEKHTIFPLKSGQTKTIKWNKKGKYNKETNKNSEEVPRIENVLAINEAFQ